jgi:hypothetical protein
MVIRTIGAAVTLALAMMTSAGAAEPVPRAAHPGQCSLADRTFIQSVKPLYSYEDAGYTAYRQFRGAEVLVPAQPGLTAEWLDRVFTSQVAAGQCDLGTSKVHVQVLSAGGGFSVRLSSDDEKGAAEILRHTQQMLR